MADDARPILTARHLKIAERLVAEGHCDSVASAIEEALERYSAFLDSRKEIPEAELEAFRAFLDERRKGPFISMADFSADVDALIGEMYARYGLPR